MRYAFWYLSWRVIFAAFVRRLRGHETYLASNAKLATLFLALMKNFSSRLEHAIWLGRQPKGDLARHMKVALSTVSRWLGGTMPSSDKILQIAAFLGVDAMWLTHGIGEPPDSNSSLLREDITPYRFAAMPQPMAGEQYAALLETLLPSLGISELMETIQVLNDKKPAGWEKISRQAITLLRQKIPN